MLEQFLMVRLEDNFIQGTILQDDPDIGPTIPQDTPPQGMQFFPFEGVFTRQGHKDSEAAYWLDDEVVWVETATLEDLRASKNAEINSRREACNTESFIFQGKAIRCRPLDRSDIDGTNGYVALFGTFPDGWQGGWKAADNSYVAISTVDDWKAFYKAMVDCGNANFRYAQQLKSRLAAAETPEQIAAITWETPSV